ncbi:unnamed protein product [Ilex paraguariensis]|uniref:Uncharacterized protein n=1 Tax=Ilex paraguariensis TaxID=185542 RepID=A0ABC8TVK8_9AQUA
MVSELDLTSEAIYVLEAATVQSLPQIHAEDRRSLPQIHAFVFEFKRSSQPPSSSHPPSSTTTTTATASFLQRMGYMTSGIGLMIGLVLPFVDTNYAVGTIFGVWSGDANWNNMKRPSRGNNGDLWTVSNICSCSQGYPWKMATCQRQPKLEKESYFHMEFSAMKEVGRE